VAKKLDKHKIDNNNLGVKKLNIFGIFKENEAISTLIASPS
jgi:hypothetical protein